MNLPRGLRPLLLSSPATLRTSTLSTGYLCKRNFAYPKEGVFQPDSPPQPQQQPQYGGPNTLAPPPPPPQSKFQYGAPLPPPPPPPTPSRYRPSWTTITIALLSASLGFYQIRTAVSDFTLGVPSEEELAKDLAEAYRIFDELELVQSLRSSWHMVDGQREPVWKEYTAYQAMTDPKERAGRLTSGPLGTAHGVAAQKVFTSDDAMVHFVCFGNGTTGWPRVVHGGALATILDESFGRFAARQVKERTALTAHLEMKYIEKVEPGQWVVIILGLDEAHKDDQTDRKKYVGGVLACCGGIGPKYTGEGFENVHPHVLATALFVVPKDISQLQPIPDEF